MAVKLVSLDDTYTPISTTSDITLSVEFGDGLDGSYAIFLGKEFIDSNTTANLGKKADVVGNNVIVSVTIVDALLETNWTSMTVIIMEGIERSIIYGPYKAQAEAHLDTVIYTLKLVC